MFVKIQLEFYAGFFLILLVLLILVFQTSFEQYHIVWKMFNTVMNDCVSVCKNKL